MRFWSRCPTFRRERSLFCSAGYLTTLACLATRPLMMQLKQLLCMEPSLLIRVLGSVVCTFLHRAVLLSWQGEWANTQGNKLHMVKPPVLTWHSSFRAVRKEVMLTPLQIVYTCLARGHLLRGKTAVFVLNVTPHLLCHTFWFTANIMAKTTICKIYTGRYLTCSVMSAVVFIMCCLF
jgi:hypothetical protein